jgi:hypothetical protein
MYCSLAVAGRSDNPIPTRFLYPIYCLKIQRLVSGLVTHFILRIPVALRRQNSSRRERNGPLGRPEGQGHTGQGPLQVLPFSIVDPDPDSDPDLFAGSGVGVETSIKVGSGSEKNKKKSFRIHNPVSFHKTAFILHPK